MPIKAVAVPGYLFSHGLRLKISNISQVPSSQCFAVMSYEMGPRKVLRFSKKDTQASKASDAGDATFKKQLGSQTSNQRTLTTTPC